MAVSLRGSILHSKANFAWTLLLSTVVAFCGSSTFAADAPNLSKHPVVIVVSYDGFRYDYLTKTSTPNLDKVKSNGVSVPYMQAQFLTYTFPNHHTIATGLYPESHGVIANSMYDPLYNKVLSGYDNEPGFWNYSANPNATSSPVVPLYTLNELAGDERYSGVMMWTGSGEAWGESKRKATHLQLYNSSIPFETRVDTVVSWITDPNKPTNLVFMYFEEPDSVGHTYGPEGPQMINKIERMDNVTGYMVNKLNNLGILDKVNLVFLSDHGMQEIKAENIARYVNVTDNSNNRMYVDYGRGSPFLQIRPVNESDTQNLFKLFNDSAKANHYTAYLRDQVPNVQPNWHYSNNRRIMPIFLVADVGFIFEGYAHPNTTGAHGFDNEEPSMRPYFMAMGPLFKNNSVQQPFQNVDIYPLVCHIMKITPRPHNGTLERVLPLLSSATKAASWIGASNMVHILYVRQVATATSVASLLWMVLILNLMGNVYLDDEFLLSFSDSRRAPLLSEPLAPYVCRKFYLLLATYISTGGAISGAAVHAPRIILILAALVFKYRQSRRASLGMNGYGGKAC